MSRRRRDDSSPTRRCLLATALGAIPARAEAQTAKLSQIAAAYQATAKGMFSCAVCTFFVRPGSCKVVAGDISPNGWCKLFDMPD